MDIKYLGIFVAIWVVDLSLAEVDPTMIIKYKKLEVTTVDNPYYGEFSTAISESELGVTAKWSVKKRLTPTMKISLTVEHQGQQVADFDDDICELIKNEIYGKDLLNYGMPVDTFPKDCPINPGDYEIREYPLPKDRFPPGTPPGIFYVKMFIGEPDQDPLVTLDIILELIHEVPEGVPTPALPSPKFGG